MTACMAFAFLLGGLLGVVLGYLLATEDMEK